MVRRINKPYCAVSHQPGRPGTGPNEDPLPLGVCLLCHTHTRRERPSREGTNIESTSSSNNRNYHYEPNPDQPTFPEQPPRELFRRQKPPPLQRVSHISVPPSHFSRSTVEEGGGGCVVKKGNDREGVVVVEIDEGDEQSNNKKNHPVPVQSSPA
jgi:hypothetical protein